MTKVSFSSTSKTLTQIVSLSDCDGIQGNCIEQRQYNGISIPPAYQSKASVVKINFISDNASPGGDGFRIIYRTVPISRDSQELSANGSYSLREITMNSRASLKVLVITLQFPSDLVLLDQGNQTLLSNLPRSDSSKTLCLPIYSFTCSLFNISSMINNLLGTAKLVCQGGTNNEETIPFDDNFLIPFPTPDNGDVLQTFWHLLGYFSEYDLSMISFKRNSISFGRVWSLDDNGIDLSTCELRFGSYLDPGRQLLSNGSPLNGYVKINQLPRMEPRCSELKAKDVIASVVILFNFHQAFDLI